MIELRNVSFGYKDREPYNKQNDQIFQDFFKATGGEYHEQKTRQSN